MGATVHTEAVGGRRSDCETPDDAMRQQTGKMDGKQNERVEGV